MLTCLSLGINNSATSQLLITVIFSKYVIVHCLFSDLKKTTSFNGWCFVRVLTVSSLFSGTVCVAY